MENSIFFSVIVPVYNVEHYLEKCIESVLTQEYKNFELILIDDGSSDFSGKICDDYSDKDGRVRVLHQCNSGLSSARNLGIENAKGEYIIFLDSDDYWYSNDVLGDLNDRLTKTHADVTSFDYVKFIDGNFSKPYFNKKESMPLESIPESLKYQIDNDIWIACAWNKAIKRELFLKNELLFKEGITSEDIDWCMRLATVANHFDYLAKVVVCYRQRETSISNSTTPEKASVLIDNIEHCLNILNSLNKKEIVEALKPYIGYQYGTAIYHVATIREQTDYKNLVKRLNQYVELLGWSNNIKIKKLRVVHAVGGIRLIMLMLNFRDKMRKIRG